MQNRFNFRVWREKIGDGLGGFYIEPELITNDGTATPCETTEGGTADYFSDDRFIVEQCTGMRDKNGTLIYECDILKNISSDKVLNYVYWQNNKWCLSIYFIEKKKVIDVITLPVDCSMFEIIGNVHTYGNSYNKEK